VVTGAGEEGGGAYMDGRGGGGSAKEELWA
jgi:hypothetical protein